MSTWCVPGAALEKGAGWRIWYARAGSGNVPPQDVRVETRNRTPVAATTHVEFIESPPAFSRRIAVVDVKLAHPAPGRKFRVTIPELNQTFSWQTRPDSIGANGISFVLASCFWQNDDGGHLQKAMRAIVGLEHPAFKLLIGDQVYLDYPFSFKPFDTPESITANRYRQYWGDSSYRGALLTTPNFFMCDDHEYWNDYPEKQIHLARTRGSKRDKYADLAEEYYQKFQLVLNKAPQRWFQFDIEPASFFVTDTRSQRTFIGEPDHAFMVTQQWDDLEAWQRGLKGPGFLVLGQPLFQADGDWKDHSFSNFRSNYDRLLKILKASLEGDNDENRPHDIVILSGDIHTGRFTWAWTGNRTRPIYEFIASPSSRIGPFTSDPSPSKAPATIPPTRERGRIPWKVHRPKSPPFETVDNNVGVVRLFRSKRRPYLLHVAFLSYLVRPYRRASWKFFSRNRKANYRDARQLRLYHTELELK